MPDAAGGPLTAVAVAVGALVGVAGASTPTQKSSVLGTKDPAKGTPVKVGVISNGKTPTIDNSQETPVAEATAQWLNEYQGGIGGHPIQVVICNDGNEPGKAVDCANQMLQEKVVAVVIGQNGVAESSLAPAPRRRHPGVQLRIGQHEHGERRRVDVHGGQSTRLSLFSLPAGVAKKAKAKKVSAVIIDVPAATVVLQGAGTGPVQEAGSRLRAHRGAGGNRRHDAPDAEARFGQPEG